MFQEREAPGVIKVKVKGTLVQALRLCTAVLSIGGVEV